MVRTPNARRPAELLDAIVDHLVEHGLADLSLRPLGKAVGASPRVLLYYFGSKEELVTRALARWRERQRDAFASLRAADLPTPAERCRAIWRQMSAPRSEAAFRLFFEVYALALRRPRQFAAFLEAAVEDWLELLAAPLCRAGRPAAEARVEATVVLAGFRGFMLDYCASRDRRRVDRAVDLWLRGLDTVTEVAEVAEVVGEGSA